MYWKDILLPHVRSTYGNEGALENILCLLQDNCTQWVCFAMFAHESLSESVATHKASWRMLATRAWHIVEPSKWSCSTMTI